MAFFYTNSYLNGLIYCLIYYCKKCFFPNERLLAFSPSLMSGPHAEEYL